MKNKFNLLIVTPHGPSGANLTHSFLDGNSRIISFPLYFQYPEWKNKFLTIEFINNFIDEYLNIFDADFDRFLKKKFTNKKNLNINKKIFTRQNFIDIILRNFKEKIDHLIDRKQFVELLHISFANLIGQDISKIKYILMHLHNYEAGHFDAICDYPNLKYIAMFRDPRETMLSHKLRGSKKFGIVFPKISKMHFYKGFKKLDRQYDDLLKIYKLIEDKSNLLIIDLNKFHILAYKGLQKLSFWLNIEHEMSINESTFLNIPWNGNAVDNKPISAFDISRSKYKWPVMMSFEDSFLVEFYLFDKFIKFGYKVDKKNFFNILKKIRLPTFSDIYFYMYFTSEINKKSPNLDFKNLILRKISSFLLILKFIYLSIFFYIKIRIDFLILFFKKADTNYINNFLA